ncbi:MAG: peptidylprolyl isomerase [Pseudomonadota bacterium]
MSAEDAENTLTLTIGLDYAEPSAEPAETAEIVIALDTEHAPQHAERMKELARSGYYDGKLFHRVIDGFMAQTGSPRGDGVGGSDLPDLKAEFSGVAFERGVVGMARTSDPNSANAQFFIMFTRYPSLDGQYTVIGHVRSGMEAVDRIKRTEQAGRPLSITPDRIIAATIAADA